MLEAFPFSRARARMQGSRAGELDKSMGGLAGGNVAWWHGGCVEFYARTSHCSLRMLRAHAPSLQNIFTVYVARLGRVASYSPWPAALAGTERCYYRTRLLLPPSQVPALIRSLH